MIEARRSIPYLRRRIRLGVCLFVMLGSVVLFASGSRAAEEESTTPGPDPGLAEQQRIDWATGAFDMPVLIRLRARVSPTWPGPRGLPPFTQRTNCPETDGRQLDFC